MDLLLIVGWPLHIENTESNPISLTGVSLGMKSGEIFCSRFRVLGVIGQGSISTVYRALNLENNQFVAIKVLHAHKTGDEELVRRFMREAELTAKLKHPHAIKIYEWGLEQTSQQKRPFMIIEYVNGESLSKRIQRGNGLGCNKAVEIMEQICSAVTAAHNLGIVHRDLKPDNIMLTNHNGIADFVKVVDFGIAKLNANSDQTNAIAQMNLTRTGDILGTMLYMSPEQLRGLKADAKSDLYSLGVVMYEMLAGKPPFASSNNADVVVGHLSRPPLPLSQARYDLVIPALLSETVMAALAKHPWERPLSVDEFSRKLALATGKAKRNEPKRNVEQAQNPQIQNQIQNKTAQFTPPLINSPLPKSMNIPGASDQNNVSVNSSGGQSQGNQAGRVCPTCLTVATGANFKFCLKCGRDNTDQWRASRQKTVFTHSKSPPGFNSLIGKFFGQFWR